MSAKKYDMSLHWRQENYGGIEAKAALRWDSDTAPESKRREVAATLRRFGFRIHSVRQAWIAKRTNDEDLCRMLVEFEDLGFTVTNMGAVPDRVEEFERDGMIYTERPHP